MNGDLAAGWIHGIGPEAAARTQLRFFVPSRMRNARLAIHSTGSSPSSRASFRSANPIVSARSNWSLSRASISGLLPQSAALSGCVDTAPRTVARRPAVAQQNSAEHRSEQCRLASRPAWSAAGRRSGQACAGRIAVLCVEASRIKDPVRHPPDMRAKASSTWRPATAPPTFNLCAPLRRVPHSSQHHRDGWGVDSPNQLAPPLRHPPA